MRSLRHLDVTDEERAGTLCGAFPEPAPSDETLTADPAAVTCADCGKAYAIARIAHLALGAAPPSEGLAAVLAAEDTKRGGPDCSPLRDARDHAGC